MISTFALQRITMQHLIKTLLSRLRSANPVRQFRQATISTSATLQEPYNDSRLVHAETPKMEPKLVHLTSRSVVQVSGKESAAFLQGLITNDIHLLDVTSGESDAPCSIYAMMLNTQGRVLYDLIIYRDGMDGFLIEQDSSLKERFLKHLQMFKLRKKVQITDASPNYQVYALFPRIQDAQKIDTFVTTPDPRLALLGTRILVSSSSSAWNDYQKSYPATDEVAYRRFRYRLGVAEGSAELPPGECFPFESNLDYLSGVHFHKGCYLGQELTARTHHTGVVRKRIMPVTLATTGEGVSFQLLSRDCLITTETGTKSVGKLRAHVDTDGIALLRISEALAADSLKIIHDGQSIAVQVKKPEWWPDPH